MKRSFVIPIPRWYLVFTIGFFFAVASITSLANSFDKAAGDTVKLKPIYQGNETQPVIAFACNVFWGEEYLPQMLDTLDAKNIKITFFIGGSWAKRYPDMLKEIAKRGHEIANHSYSHPHPNRLSRQENQEQIQKTEKLVEEVTGIKTSLYAPPYGEFNETVLLAANELGYRTIMWSIDTIDWKRPPVDILQNRVLKKLHKGAIILMHPTEPTAQALPGLISEIEKQGYTISTVSSILQ